MKYRKKPVVVEAVQYTGSNQEEILLFCKSANCKLSKNPNNLIIKTLEGEMEASVNDYIIKGVEGKFCPCKPDIFNKTYVPATDEITDKEYPDYWAKREKQLYRIHLEEKCDKCGNENVGIDCFKTGAVDAETHKRIACQKCGYVKVVDKDGNEIPEK